MRYASWWSGLGGMVAVIAVACGGDGATGTDGGTRPDDAGDRPDASIPVEGELRSVTVGPFRVEPGVEETVCVALPVGNETPMMLRSIRTHLTEGSHHMIVYRLDGTAPDPTPRPCGAFSHGVAASLFIAQQPEASLSYPAGSGLRFEANQVVTIEMHYLNYFSGSATDIGGSVDFDLVPVDPGVEEVELIFTGELSLDIPARSETTVRSFHSIPAGARVFALTSHTHQLGVLSTLHRGRGETDPDAVLLHESRSWADPPLDTFEPPLTFSAGEGLILECHYVNTTDRRVGFGTGFDDEMCFLWAHFVP